MNTCRLCNEKLSSIINLGQMPLANALCNEEDQESKKYPLEVMLCYSCGLAQLKETIDPELLFSDYVYLSSHSQTMLASAKELTERFLPTLSPESLVIEIASNDGYLLKNYVDHKIPVLGIDPAENIAQQANAKGIKTKCCFFNSKVALSLANQKADVIHANNVLAHVPDLKDFIKGLKLILKENGTITIEFPYLVDLIHKLEFDTIYHEHVYYLSLKPLKKAFEEQGLEIFYIEKLSIHGGTLRLFVGHRHENKVDSIVSEMMKQESFLYDPSTYQRFNAGLSTLKMDLKSHLSSLKSKGYKLAAYGASAKGAIALNFFDIGKEFIDFIVDKNPLKQGRYMPGKNIPIYSIDKLLDSDFALLLSWNFKEEIVAQQKEFIKKGGRFIVPLPQVDFVP